MLYRLNSPLIIKMDRRDKGEVVELDEVTAKTLGDAVSPIGEVPEKEDEVVEEEIVLAELTKQELVDLAGKKGLSTTGSKADLIERLTLSIS